MCPRVSSWSRVHNLEVCALQGIVQCRTAILCRRRLPPGDNNVLPGIITRKWHDQLLQLDLSLRYYSLRFLTYFSSSFYTSHETANTPRNVKRLVASPLLRSRAPETLLNGRRHMCFTNTDPHAIDFTITIPAAVAWDFSVTTPSAQRPETDPFDQGSSETV